jgi:hypothetical protein
MHPHIVIFSIHGCCIEIVKKLHYTNILRNNVLGDMYKERLKIQSISVTCLKT